MSRVSPIKHVRYLSQNPPGPTMGMGNYERLMMQHVSQSANPAEWSFEIIFDGRSRGQQIDPALIPGGLSVAAYAGFSITRTTRWPWWLARLAARWTTGRQAPTLYHSLALTDPAPSNAPAVYTIHDLAPARFPGEGAFPVWAETAARAARAIVTSTSWSKRELMALLKIPDEKVHVIPIGCEHDRFHPGIEPADPETLLRLGLKTPFLAYLGGCTRRKNLANLLEAWKQIASRFPDVGLALIGPTKPLGELVAKSGALRVVATGYLDPQMMPTVLKASLGLVYPSIYEGFGLPPLEAMAMGLPVVAVDNTAVAEVTAGHAVLALDGSADALAQAMVELLTDLSAANAKYQSAGINRALEFSWTKHAEQVLTVYREILS